MISLLQRWQRPLFALGFLALIALAWRAYGGRGVALVGSGMVLWGLLHVTRIVHVLYRASQRPVGHVDSAIMLNAKLKTGMPLLHVMALTRSIGACESQAKVQPEIYVWTDSGGSSVRAEFAHGRLQAWTLTRPTSAP